MGFEVYRGKDSRSTRHRGAAMRVGRNRMQLTFNQDAHDALGTPTHVVLLHDGARIAVRAASDGDHPSHCYAVSQHRQIGAKGYMSDHDIKPGLYPGHVEGGLLVFDPASAWLDEQAQ